MSRFGATIFGVSGLRLTGDEVAFIKAANPFGFILFARNIDTEDQVRALCDDLRAALGRDCLITIDQEGGRVQRLRAPHWREWLPPLDFIAKAGGEAARAMYLRGRMIAAELRAIGIDSNCAPMLDIADADTHPFLRNRCYSNGPDQVAALGLAHAEGLMTGGVVPVVKHMPGHGRATLDSHLALPHVTADAETLRSWDFAPFRALNHLPMGMTAHLQYDALDAQPATLSSTVMQMIRRDIGFDGLIMTDDISMQALQGPLDALSTQALAAGCDVVLHCNGVLAECEQVAAAAGTMTAAAQARAEAAVAARATPDAIDIQALAAELDCLMD